MGRASKGLELERLDKLRQAGVLTESEFLLEKRKLLEGGIYVIEAPKKKNSGCLNIFLIGCVIFFAYLVSSEPEDKNERFTVHSSGDLKNTPIQKECDQINKDLFYFYKVNAFCRNQLNMPEFDVGFGDKAFFDYRENINCSLPSVEESKRDSNIVENAVNKAIDKAGSLKGFCQNEIPYFNKIVQKYGS